MLRRLGLAIRFAICTLGAGLPAHANCLLIDELDKLHIIQSRLANDPATGLFATDIRQLRVISSGISNRAAVDAVEGNSFTGHGADVVRFLQETQLLLQRASLDDPQSVRGHFNRETRANLARVGTHLTDLRCRSDQIAIDAQIAAERGTGGSSDAEDLAEVTETLNGLADEVFQLRSLLILILVVTGTSLIMPLVRHRLILRRRRAKRHNITYPTHYLHDDRKIEGMLIDINCHGTKLRHETDNPLAKGVQVDIEVCDAFISGTVMWSNAHYSGIQFRNLISLAEVEILRKTEPTPKTKNGAPKDAA